MCTTNVNNATKGLLSQISGDMENIVIGQIHWKGCAYPVRNIDTERQTFRVSVESLRDELINDMRNGIYEAKEACEEIDGFCIEEELRTLSDSELYRMYC